MYFTGFLTIIIQSNCIDFGMDWSRKQQSSQFLQFSGGNYVEIPTYISSYQKRT